VQKNEHGENPPIERYELVAIPLSERMQNSCIPICACTLAFYYKRISHRSAVGRPYQPEHGKRAEPKDLRALRIESQDPTEIIKNRTSYFTDEDAVEAIE
jgi:hypothetical protein